jgi:segregation and condensation protein A
VSTKRKPELKLVEDTGSQLEAEDLLPELPPQQSEMPFAVVEGEPMTELPRDLYIPPDALQVFLEAFEGPLDLLLYLIRKQNIDILDIPIAEITRQYMKYIEVMTELQLELAGEYLLMAAMLAEIKSRMLLPRPSLAEGSDEDDPRAELVRRLQEYERFKKAAEDIDALTRQERDTITASAELEDRQIVKMMPDVTLQEMLLAFRDVLTRAEKFAHHHISRERLSVRQRMSDILSNLQNVAFFDFTQLFNPQEGRMGVTVTFIAILELMKEGLIEIVQAEAYAPIHIRAGQGARQLKVVPNVAAAEADAENAAALAQPELAGENDLPEDEDVVVEAAAEVVDTAPVSEIEVSDQVTADADDVADIDAVEADADLGGVDNDDAEAEAFDTVADDIEALDAVLTEGVIENSAVLTEALSEEPVALEDLPSDGVALTEATAEAVIESGIAAEALAEELAPGEQLVEEHVVPEHVVDENVVPENVVPEHVIELSEAPVDQFDANADLNVDTGTDAVEDEPTPESPDSLPDPSAEQGLSPDDDRVTDPSSEADNSDAEKSR